VIVTGAALGFNPQPVTASVLGVGSDGRTTWQLAPGQPSGTLSDNGVVGTATLIEGPNDAQLFISNDIEYLSGSCTINNGLADCTLVANFQGSVASDSLQETASPFRVQVGAGPASPTSPSPPPASSTNSPSQPPQQQPASSPSPAQTANPVPATSGAAATAPATTPNGAHVLATSSILSGIVGLIVVLRLL